MESAHHMGPREEDPEEIITFEEYMLREYCERMAKTEAQEAAGVAGGSEEMSIEMERVWHAAESEEIDLRGLAESAVDDDSYASIFRDVEARPRNLFYRCLDSIGDGVFKVLFLISLLAVVGGAIFIIHDLMEVRENVREAIRTGDDLMAPIIVITE